MPSTSSPSHTIHPTPTLSLFLTHPLRDDAEDAAQGLLQLLQARQAQDALALGAMGASLDSLNGLSAALTSAAVAGGGDPLEALAFYQQGRGSVQGFMHPLLQQHYAAAAAAAAAGRGRQGYRALGLEGDDGLSLSASGVAAGVFVCLFVSNYVFRCCSHASKH